MNDEKKETNDVGIFKKENTFEKRQSLSARLLKQYPERIPVIVEISRGNTFTLNRKKFVAPDVTFGAFINELRKHSTLKPTEALFLFCANDVLVPTNSTMSQLYKKYKDDDGFLYVTASLENTFG